MIIIEILQYCLATVMALLLGYQLLLSLAALWTTKRTSFHTGHNRRFAIVIPAHNEEQVLAKSLYSMSGLVYPKNMYDLIVIADNCTDRTARIARDIGAKVLEREHTTERGKGYALRWAFDQILSWEKSYDAIVVFDSDSLVSGNYLDVMNYYLENGSKVIQSSDLVLPQAGVWSSEATRIGFLLYNLVKPLGRKVLGFSMGLRGNGMCFAAEVLRKHPWEAMSLTEDVEFGLILRLRGIGIDFAPEAVVWAQMPAQSTNAESQRQRWEMGRYPIVKTYAPKMLRAAIRNRSLSYLDSFVDLITPPLVNTLLLVVGMSVLNIALWAVGWLSITFTWLWTGIAVLGLLHLFVGLYAAKADKEVYKSILYIPLYVLWKIKLYFKFATRDHEQQWIRTTRET